MGNLMTWMGESLGHPEKNFVLLSDLVAYNVDFLSGKLYFLSFGKV